MFLSCCLSVWKNQHTQRSVRQHSSRPNPWLRKAEGPRTSHWTCWYGCSPATASPPNDGDFYRRWGRFFTGFLTFFQEVEWMLEEAGPMIFKCPAHCGYRNVKNSGEFNYVCMGVFSESFAWWHFILPNHGFVALVKQWSSCDQPKQSSIWGEILQNWKLPYIRHCLIPQKNW